MLKKSLVCFLSVIFMVSSSQVFAGDIMPKDTVLEEESYVFSIEEASGLLRRIEELEVKEKQLEYYIQLDSITKQKIRLHESNVDLFNYQISEYDRIIQLNSSEINRLHKRARFSELEKFGMLVLGMALTTTGFIVVDQITDTAILP
jgi:hypothetical protein